MPIQNLVEDTQNEKCQYHFGKFFTNNYLLFYLLIYYYDCYRQVLYQNLEKNNVSNVPKGTYFINC